MRITKKRFFRLVVSPSVFLTGTLSALFVYAHNLGIKNAQLILGTGCILAILVEVHFILLQFVTEDNE